MQKNSKQTVMGYGERFHDWFQQSFRCDTPLSNRINCYFDFDVLGKRLPASFLL
jgi:hypothetical protein